jgi:hypothetical protein
LAILASKFLLSPKSNGAFFFAAGEPMSLTDEDKRWIAEQLKQMEARIDDRAEKLETKLLTAFHGWARSMEIRTRALAEERISEL